MSKRISTSVTMDYPLGITSFKGINIPWLVFATGGETAHDGYGNAFNDFYFNGVGANADIGAQLDAMTNAGIRYARLWINIYHYMNSDKASVGFTAYRTDLVPNLRKFCDWCNDRNIKLLIMLDDGWYTFQWTWITGQFRQSYIDAFHTLVAAIKDKPAVWAWDYGNEPYMGWGSGLSSTIKTYQNVATDVGVTRYDLTNFFIDLYADLKSTAPDHYFSVGSSTTTDLSNFNIAACSDFYQVHTYPTRASSFTTRYDDYDKPVIIGEFGYNKSGEYLTHLDFSNKLYKIFLQNGFPLVMGWSWASATNRESANNYSVNGSISMLSGFIETPS